MANLLEFDKHPKLRNRAGHFRVISPIEYRGRRWKVGRTVKLHERISKRLLAENKIIPLPKPRFIDVFNTDFKLPEKVIILGSGPRGKQGYKNISPDDFVISLNGALSCPVHTDIWMAMDPTLQRQKYFRDLMLDYYYTYYKAGKDLTYAGIGHGYPVPFMEKMRVARYFPWVSCVFDLIKPKIMKKNDIVPARGYLRPGCTVGGAAVQFAYMFGAKEIVLCGIDMYGNIYHDGSKHKQIKRSDKQWGVVPIFNQLMRHIENDGVKFYTLSETRLNVERI